jgi:CoA-transferase family III
VPPEPAPTVPPGARERWVADWARSGVVELTGHADGPPLVPPGCGATVAGALADRLAELTDGRVRVDGAALLGERAALLGHRRNGRISAGGACRLLPTADGWAAVSCARPDDPALLGALVSADLPDDPWPAVADWLRHHPGAELAERATLLGLAAAPVRESHIPGGIPDLPAPRAAEGLLVVDFSALWAGPLAAHLLGLGGARVVKVETPDRPDGARRGHAGFYRLLHGGHRSVVLDPTDAAGRRALHALVAAADVVIEASRPRALAGWGLDARATAGTWISITAAGRASDRVGFGDDIAAAAGLVARDDRGDPVFCGDAIADPLAGLSAAVLALTAPAGLHEVSMTDVVAATLDGHPPAGPDPVAVAAPVARSPVGTAPASGADTAAVLAELHIPIP